VPSQDYLLYLGAGLPGSKNKNKSTTNHPTWDRIFQNVYPSQQNYFSSFRSDAPEDPVASKAGIIFDPSDDDADPCLE
jgi:hypothetical protein